MTQYFSILSELISNLQGSEQGTGPEHEFIDTVVSFHEAFHEMEDDSSEILNQLMRIRAKSVVQTTSTKDEKSSMKKVDIFCTFSKYWIWFYTLVYGIFTMSYFYCESMIQYFRMVGGANNQREYYVGYWSGIYLIICLILNIFICKKHRFWSLAYHSVSLLVYSLGAILEIVLIIQSDNGVYEPTRGAIVVISAGLISIQIFQIFLLLSREFQHLFKESQSNPFVVPGYYDRFENRNNVSRENP